MTIRTIPRFTSIRLVGDIKPGTKPIRFEKKIKKKRVKKSGKKKAVCRPTWASAMFQTKSMESSTKFCTPWGTHWGRNRAQLRRKNRIAKLTRDKVQQLIRLVNPQK